MKRLLKLLGDATKGWIGDRSPRLAAAVAFYTMISLSPLLILTVALAGFFFGEQAVREEVVERAQAVAGDEAAAVVDTVLRNAADPQTRGGLAAIASIVFLVFGASAVFVELHLAMNKIWEKERRPRGGMARVLVIRLISFGMILVAGFLIFLSIVVTAVITALGRFLSDQIPVALNLLMSVLNVVVFLLIISALFAVLFKFLPDAEVKWRPAWRGGILTAILFAVGNYAISYYLTQTTVGSVYGAAGSLVAFLLWVYYSSLIFFFGAEFTHVYAAQL